ncbi:MAG: DNA cytosine methyltransferase [Leptospiraceae bacterium]|nr:DNA cytosine methyltransferase [Leptospiraceae bacterium]
MLIKIQIYLEGLRPYTTREYARLQGVPDWFQFFGNDSQVYKQIGNGVPVVFGEWIGREINRYFGK